MKSTAIACAIAAGALGFGSLSYADSDDDDGRRDRRDFSQRDHRWDRDDRASHRDHREARRSSYIVQQPPVVPEYNRGRHSQYGQYEHYRRDGHWEGRTHRFQRGEHLPYEYRQRQYYVNDWRSHQLYAPPHGYQWVQADDGDYLLMALATGLIVNLMLNQ